MVPIAGDATGDMLTRALSAISPASRTGLPPRMRVLFVTTQARTGAWLAQALAGDSATKIDLEEALGMIAGLERVREETFDAVLVSHEPGRLDALDLAEAIRAGGSDEPVLILGEADEAEMAAFCHEAGADGYVCVGATAVRTFLWVLARGVERQSLLRENRRLAQAERARLKSERDEAERVLSQQRNLLQEPGTARGKAADDATTPHEQPADDGDPHGCHPAIRLPTDLGDHYRGLLRAYVMMGSGNLGQEMASLATLLVGLDVTSRQVMQLHVETVEELIQGLGSRSARHVLNRADLLALELMMHLSDVYRGQSAGGPGALRQQLLPGFEAAAA